MIGRIAVPPPRLAGAAVDLDGDRAAFRLVP
jgi:hypothetical protein